MQKEKRREGEAGEKVKHNYLLKGEKSIFIKHLIFVYWAFEAIMLKDHVLPTCYTPKQGFPFHKKSVFPELTGSSAAPFSRDNPHSH